MKVLADANLLMSEGDLPAGMTLQRMDGRKIDAALLHDADVLLVRSITRVDEALLKDSDVKFVGTATSGTDHLDLEYLTGRGIECCSAPGSNADAVADYCLAAIAFAVEQLDLAFGELPVGIVGAGNVGGRLASRLAALDCPLLINDPPLEQSGVSEIAGHTLSSLDSLTSCQVLSLHVPLRREGEHPTLDLIDREFIKALPDSCLLINTCRAEVISAEALTDAIHKENLYTAIDVWRNEPDVDAALVKATTLATPHIAGYSTRAKRNGALQVLTQLRNFAIEQGFISEDSEQLPDTDGMEPFLMDADPDVSHWQMLETVLPLKRISEQFKKTLAAHHRSNSFDQMRKAMQQRKEFSEHWFSAENLADDKQETYQALGFQVLR